MHHDLIIIGTGSGNMVADDSFSDLDVGFVEERRAGGTCLNFGCIPSKMLAYTADVVDTVSGAAEFDVDASLGGLRWSDLRNRIFTLTDSKSLEGREARESSDHTTYYDGHAEFTGPRQLRVADPDGKITELTADQIVIANGGRPVIPPVVGDSGLPYETSDTIMRIDAPPRRLAVLGGGYIAAELAHVFSAAGSDITIIEQHDELLGGPQDGDVRAAFTELMSKRWDLRLGVELSAIGGSPGNLELTLDDGSTVQADMLLVASGRRPNSDRLNLEVSGVDIDDHGRIVVDEFGLTEENCREDHHGYRVGRTPYGDVAYGWAMQDHSGFCKVLVDGGDGRILGAHIIGPQAASLIQILVVAMEFGITAADLAHRPYWIHPALTEVVSNALLNVEEVA